MTIHKFLKKHRTKQGENSLTWDLFVKKLCGNKSQGNCGFLVQTLIPNSSMHAFATCRCRYNSMSCLFVNGVSIMGRENNIGS